MIAKGVARCCTIYMQLHAADTNTAEADSSCCYEMLADISELCWVWYLEERGPLDGYRVHPQHSSTGILYHPILGFRKSDAYYSSARRSVWALTVDGA